MKRQTRAGKKATRSKRRLILYMNATRVGVLEKKSTGAIEFKYDKEWIEEQYSFPVSQSIPLDTSIYRGSKVSSFFDNLLPDNKDIRKRVAERLGAESTQEFDLLGLVGRDCVGAFQLIPENEPEPKVEKATGKKVTQTEVGKILQNLHSQPLGMDLSTNFRLSIAGAQEKTALLKMNGNWYIPRGATPTTHILKPVIGMLRNGIDLRTSVENEWLCMKIADRLGLTVPKVEIVQFLGQKCLVVERFDRHWSKDNKTLYRLPQEDMCQALGVPAARKYEDEGGPGIKEIMDFLNGSDSPKEDRAAFMRAQLIFLLLGATDGHAKNFSIFSTETGFSLTPMYDIVSMAPAMTKGQVQHKDFALAMSVGKSRHRKMKYIQKRHFEESAKICGYSLKELQSIMVDINSKLDRLFKEEIRLPPGFPQWLYKSILKRVENARKILV